MPWIFDESRIEWNDDLQKLVIRYYKKTKIRLTGTYTTSSGVREYDYRF